MTRSRLVAAVTAAACGVTMSAAPVVSNALGSTPTKRTCVKSKTYKKNGKTYRRCARYR